VTESDRVAGIWMIARRYVPEPDRAVLMALVRGGSLVEGLADEAAVRLALRSTRDGPLPTEHPPAHPHGLAPPTWPPEDL
jgi:hypothetical protein